MTSEVRDRCMRLLAHAKQGDEHSHKMLVDLVAESYEGMIRRFYTADPILGRDDIRGEFYWGIWRAVAVLDERGDPIFHLAQRGQWAVKSVITAVNRRRHGTTEPEGGVQVVSLDARREGEDVFEPADESVEADPQAIVEIYEDRRRAHDRVLRILVKAELRPRQEDILQKMLDGELDLDEPCARKHLARELGVTGQRVTQILRGMTERLTEADAA